MLYASPRAQHGEKNIGRDHVRELVLHNATTGDDAPKERFEGRVDEDGVEVSPAFAVLFQVQARAAIHWRGQPPALPRPTTTSGNKRIGKVLPVRHLALLHARMSTPSTGVKQMRTKTASSSSVPTVFPNLSARRCRP
jgi:hypothetical protein